jgi:alpha/beta superfamily hydrolase
MRHDEELLGATAELEFSRPVVPDLVRLRRALSDDLSGPAVPALEIPAYYTHADGQIYSVLHKAPGGRRGAVLVCGPFGAERERAYVSLATWARTLAARGFDTLRFDYRGIGESSGRFEEQTLSHWREDAELCAARLSALAGDVPLILQGVRLGGIIAAELFAAGIGDALLLWAPPASACELLRETMRHDLIAQRFNDPRMPARTREAQLLALESGERVNIDGYSWSRELWRDAQEHALIVPSDLDPRPWSVLCTRTSSVCAGRAMPSVRLETVDAEDFWGTSSMLIVPRIDGFFRASLRWLDECRLWSGRIS